MSELPPITVGSEVRLKGSSDYGEVLEIGKGETYQGWAKVRLDGVDMLLHDLRALWYLLDDLELVPERE